MESQRPRRSHAQARAEMREGILRVGGELLAKDGPAGLSVREIARGLGVASSAIYRHVASRDELLTLLLEDAYTDLADWVDAALAGASGRDALAALAGTMRAWAVNEPQRWALVYGSPVPGYVAPAERTTGPGTRVMARFLGLLAAGESAESAAAPGDVRDAAQVPRQTAVPSPEYAALLTAGAAELGVEAEPALAAAGVLAWTSLVGLISAQVFGQLGQDFTPYGEEMLTAWVRATADTFGLN